jgi:hypothetical protein
MNEQTRPTKDVITPSGTKATIKTYLTARESNQLKQVLYADIKMTMTDIGSGKTEVKDVPATVLLDQERKALEMVIVSLNSSAENIAERLLDLPSTEYDALVAEVNLITRPDFTKGK